MSTFVRSPGAGCGVSVGRLEGVGVGGKCGSTRGRGGDDGWAIA